MLQRNLLYTGMTRAKKLLVLIGSRKALSMAINNINNEPRFSLLPQRLKRGEFR
jgi:exodeoxyribonuclease V alpha subunit